MSGKGFISKEKEQKCQTCKMIRECRPYGLNGEQICYHCGLKDIETTEKMMNKHLLEGK